MDICGGAAQSTLRLLEAGIMPQSHHRNVSPPALLPPSKLCFLYFHYELCVWREHVVEAEMYGFRSPLSVRRTPLGSRLPKVRLPLGWKWRIAP